jgi:hypothetical protein
MAAHLTTRLTVYRPGSAVPEARLYPTAWSASFVHNDPGGGSMDVEIAKQVAGEALDRGARWLQTDAEVAVEVNAANPTLADDGFREIRNGRFVVLRESHDIITKSSSSVRATLQPYAFLLSKARVWSGPSYGKGVDAGKRRFHGTIGAIWRQLMDEAQDRGALPTIRCNVTAGGDSITAAWTQTTTQVLDIGQDYLSLLNQFVSAGFCDAYFQGNELVMRRPDSDAITQDPPVLSAGTELLSAPRESDGTNLATHAIALGDGGVAVSAASAALSTTGWGRWETSLSVSGATSPTVIGERARSTLNLYASDRLTTSAVLSLHPDGALPLRDYQLGGWVQLQAADGPAEVFQVSSLTLARSASSPLTGGLELGRRRIIPERRMVAKLNQLSAGVAMDSGAGRMVAPTTPVAGWLDYTPQWLGGAGGVVPLSLGNGVLLGRYWQTGTTVHFRLEMTWGSTTPAPATGQWFFTLPVDANPTIRQHVTAWLFDGGFNFTGPAIVAASGDKISATAYAGNAQGAMSTITPTVPFTWAAGDTLRIQGTYEAAVVE